MRTGQILNPATDEEAANQWSPRNGIGEDSSLQQAVQLASEKWNELVENEKTEETKLLVTAAVHDEVSAMEHHRYFETVDIGSLANNLQCAKVNPISEPDLFTTLVPFPLTPTHIDPNPLPGQLLDPCPYISQTTSKPKHKEIPLAHIDKNPRK